MHKRWIEAIGATIILAGGAIGYAVLRNAPESTPVFNTVPVDRASIVSKITATGTLSALVTVQVGSQVSGRIKELLADFNSRVEKGQVLARLDPQMFEAALSQARANHEAAKANVTKAKVEAEDAAKKYERAQRLADRKLIAPADAETAEASANVAHAQVAAARANILQAEASLEQARVNLGYATIISPISGIVISRNVDVGQTVAASLQAPVLFEIAEDLRRMQVDTSVAEADVGALRSGMEATFTVDAYPSKPFAGKIRQIRNSPTMVQNVVTYDAVIDVANDQLLLKPGMTANVTFIVARHDDVLRVPNAALRFRPSPSGAGDQAKQGDAVGRAVYVARLGDAVRVPIETGLSDGQFTEVVGGALEEGDDVIVGTNGADSTGPSRRRPPGFL